MDEATLERWFTRDRRSERVALCDATGREYDAHWLCTSAWKAGNFLRHAGVREGVRVGVAGDGPVALLAFVGTALLEAETWFDPPEALADEPDVRAVVAPSGVLERYDLPPGAQRVGYGGRPEEPAAHHLDAGLWSENPSFPPLEIDPETPLVRTERGSLTHGAALEAAETVASEWDLEPGTCVGLATPVAETLADPSALVAGVLAPLVADGVTVLLDSSGEQPAPALEYVVGCAVPGVERLSVPADALGLE
ncbi:hypothetical protein [Natronobiforma cellulositropha]|uniref:hypothetical protein n=1 Tax=Natronobiforma cellulositropha TaxID=1679076 RepID=UPI0021D58948|nr:hypothetical protein [Natronobiforma cellulositropha]